MTITDFSLLTLTEQLSLLYVDGVYLSKRKSGNTTVLLFQLQNVYVEIFYIKYRQVVDHVRFSDSLDILDPYLDSISIGNLLSANG